MMIEQAIANGTGTHYAIHHVTRFTYNKPVYESAMEVRMQPRSEGRQRCSMFSLQVSPRARVHSYRNHVGNTVHHFDIPRAHEHLTVTADALVEVMPMNALPDRLDPSAWDQIDQEVQANDYWHALCPSHFTEPTDKLQELAEEIVAVRRDDPLTVLRDITVRIYLNFAYCQRTTEVDSQIDLTLESRQGVCQDFAHIFIALVRPLGIPTRYVSGYLFHDSEEGDRSADDATHAWAECLLPELGWVGFDPTNNLLGDERHIRVAVGRDYGDVPPTRGIYKGDAESKLSVSVKVNRLSAPPPPEDVPTPTRFMNLPGDQSESTIAYAPNHRNVRGLAEQSRGQDKIRQQQQQQQQ